MSNVARTGRGLRILGISLALLNVVLWFCAPAIRAFVDQTTGRRLIPNNPRILTGVQELFVYFDPWLARGVFPAIYLVGFAAIPYLKKPNDAHKDRGLERVYTVITSLILIGLEMVWVSLIAIAVLLRGPDWNLYWPGEQMDVHKLVPLNNINLSQRFWHWMGSELAGMSWPVREVAGLVLIGSYLVLGIVIAYGLFRMEQRETPFWRWIVLVLLLQIAALVPFKMACRELFDVKYWIALPEYFFYV